MTPGASVIVIGNCTVDLSFAVPRFPRAGETLLASGRRRDLGGKGANQAVVARRFGAATTLAAPLGRDPDGDWACTRLEAEGLPSAAIRRTHAATDQSILYVTPDGENAIVSSHESAALATPEWAAECISAGSESGFLLMQGNLPLTTTITAMRAARARGLTTVINPAPIQYGYDDLFPLTDIAVLNEVEATQLGGDPDPLSAGRVIQQRGVPMVIVTLGPEGAVLLDAQGISRFPAPPVLAVDTVGAGDTFCGALVACLARRIGLQVAIAAAVDAASLTVTRPGTQTSFPTAAEAVALLARHGVQT